MKLSELIHFQSNWSRLEEIKKNRKNIIPFVGAGISKGCGLYTWGELLHQLSIDYLTAEEMQVLESRGDVFAYADQIVAAAGNSDMIMKRIREIFAQRSVSLSEIPYLLVSMFSPMIITTNYDTFLEDAANKSPLGPLKPLLPCLVGQMNEAIQINDRRLLKLHGSVEETQSFVFTTEQYRTFYGEPNNREKRLLPAYLTSIFFGKKVFFVGCSLDRDYTLEVLEECVQQKPSISHYAIVPYLLDSDQRIQRNRELSKLGIEPIFYPEGDYQAVNRLIHYLAEDNNFISSIRPFLTKDFGGNEKTAFQVHLLLSILKESYYRTAIHFPALLDIDNVNMNFTDDVVVALGTSRRQTDTILSLCKDVFSVYVKGGYIRCEKEVITYFSEQFEEAALKETVIEPLLQKRWTIKRNLSDNSDDDLFWIANVSDKDINAFANDLLETLQYSNGMSYDVWSTYCTAKKLLKLAEERIDFEIRIKLFNSIGAFGHSFQDSQTAIDYLEKAIHEISVCGDTSRKYMLLKSKCYANLAITRSLSSNDMRPALEAAEQDIILKKKYNESPILYSRSLNFYATVLKEFDPFRACEIYLETANIKETIISDGQNSEQIRELTASWATTVFNMGLLAKDLELYDLAYRIVCYANLYRFKTVDYCNRDYCSSVNVAAELELFVKEKQNIEWLIRGIESRIDLPKGFSNTLAHTWYVCAYYYYLKNEYITAIKYVNKSIHASGKKGAFVDFRQEVRTKLLLADIKYAQGRTGNCDLKEALSIIIDIKNQITNQYGPDSFYLISPIRRLLAMCKESEETSEYNHMYNELIKRYAPAISDAEANLEAYIISHDR